jgi:hypothetical protein
MPIPVGNNTLTIRTFPEGVQDTKLSTNKQHSLSFSPPSQAHPPACTASFCVLFSLGPSGDRGALNCQWNAIATPPIGLVSFQARSILPVAEEQRRTRGGQSGGVTDQPQCQGLWHRNSPSARSLSCRPSSPPPSFTPSPSFPRSLVRDGQTSPHRPRLVVSQAPGPSGC